MENQPFGYELLVDAYDCDPKTMEDINLWSEFLDEVVNRLGVQKQSPAFIFKSPNTFPDKAGLSGWIPLIESGIQIHTLTVKNFISIDFYTCSTIDDNMREILEEFVREVFKPRKLETIFFERGIHYYE